MDIKEVFKSQAKKYNQFQESNLPIDNDFQCEHSCKTCIRKHFSYPYTCNDGWPLGNINWIDRGSKCINWTNDFQCKID